MIRDVPRSLRTGFGSAHPAEGWVKNVPGNRRFGNEVTTKLELTAPARNGRRHQPSLPNTPRLLKPSTGTSPEKPTADLAGRHREPTNGG